MKIDADVIDQIGKALKQVLYNDSDEIEEITETEGNVPVILPIKLVIENETLSLQ